MELANSKPDPYLMSAATGYPNVKGANQGVILEIRRERTSNGNGGFPLLRHHALERR